MGFRKNYDFQGEQVLGEEIEFEVEKEGWNTYILHDGTKIRLKTVAAKIVRLDKRKENGEPIYLINSQNVVATDIPENLIEKES